MRRSLSRVVVWLFAAVALGLTGCGGGGGGGGTGSSYVPAKSSSFDPTTATAKASAKSVGKEVASPSSQLVPVHWVYRVNNGNPVAVNVNGLSIGINITSLETAINPTDLRRHVSMSGTVSGSANGTSFGGSYNVTAYDSLFIDAGKTYFSNESMLMGLTVSAAGQSATVQLASTVKNLTPPYEWFLDREDLDQLALNYTFSDNCSGTADFNVSITEQNPLTRTDVPVTTNDTWTVVDKLATMPVQGVTYANIVKVQRTTQLPDISGVLTPVTMYYWVAKGVGVIKGQGLYRVLNVDDVVIELVSSNLSQT